MHRFSEILGQSLPADFQNLKNGLPGAGVGDILGEGTLKRNLVEQRVK